MMPKSVCILGAFFLTREIEMSCALACNMKLLENENGLAVSWKLPASKTDPQAVSTTREWGCLCKKGRVSPCPAHMAKEHLQCLEVKFSKTQIDSGELPLFPDESGGFCSKESVVETIEQLAVKTGASLLDDLGRRAFGGHSARVSGARYLASIGLELFKLMVLARWAGPTILRYVNESPLAHSAGLSTSFL